MSIRIITDSASDIEQQEFEQIQVLPLMVTIDGVTYRDGIDLKKNEFYKKLEESDAMPVSSLISPYEFEQAFEKVTAQNDEAIVLPISSELSGTYQSAVAAAADFENITVMDTRQVSGSQRILILRCLQLIKEGLSREAIVKQLGEEKEKIRIFAAVDTLKYLQKGGRISKGSAIVGGIVGIKPILTLEEGKLIAIGKARGSKQSNLFLNKQIEEVGGIDFSMPYAVGYSGTDDSNLRKYMESNQELLDAAPHEVDVVQIGSAVGTHAGPGAVLVTFFVK